MYDCKFTQIPNALIEMHNKKSIEVGGGGKSFSEFHFKVEKLIEFSSLPYSHLMREDLCK